MAYAVMAANGTNDVYLDAVSAVYEQAKAARELFEAAAYPDDGGAE